LAFGRRRGGSARRGGKVEQIGKRYAEGREKKGRLAKQPWNPHAKGDEHQELLRALAGKMALVEGGRSSRRENGEVQIRGRNKGVRGGAYA